RAARLAPAFARMGGAELIAHFRERARPRFFEGFDEAARENPRSSLSSKEFDGTIEEARAIVAHRWPLLGYGALNFGAEVDWLRDPASGVRWPLDYHGDVRLVRGDGSDVRVLWELNRLGHLVTLGRAYALTRDESFAEEFFAQVESWRAQNPTDFGPNWACAMEVSLRAMNLLAAFHLLRRSRALDERRLAAMLALLGAHASHVRRNLEYSFIATGNHYLSDVVGLLWLGVCLPELEEASAWRAFALGELLGEMDKQVLADGADCEASTGYHGFVTELLLYSFILCRANGIEIEERYWTKLRSMLEYVRAYLRPDGRAPLVGDADGGRALSLVRRAADEQAYLLGIGAALFCEPRFKTEERAPEEIFWLLGDEGVRMYAELATEGARAEASEVFERAGMCVLRAGDLYLMLSASGAGLAGRGAHGHNDALSVEVSACGISFIADPGTYVYTSDPQARHLFRSTAQHSTVQVDAAEQNEISVDTPFLIGDEARPRVLAFGTGDERDFVVAEHRGYERLTTTGPVTHRRAVLFDKRESYWLIEDTFAGSGAHAFTFRFHAAPGRDTRVRDGSTVE
ncbi:MAG: alginate lyase family protein, partial [Rubrivivax sp.]|nr:alginate lyase family protein [Pyrinomonadaceae bacterium]